MWVASWFASSECDPKIPPSLKVMECCLSSCPHLSRVGRCLGVVSTVCFQYTSCVRHFFASLILSNHQPVSVLLLIVHP